ncbi:protein kinase [Mycobacterium intermedium]|nr:protein kinase [Mycobacterium intermedium]
MAAASFGRYQLLDLLGRGGMGEVYRAHDTVTERVVAIKLLPAGLAGDPDFEKRFRREAKAAAGLNDPHVVPIHSYGEIDGQLYVDMRLVEGRDLHTVITQDGGRLSAERSVAIIEQVASALDSAHRVGLVHRDVKPSNILLTESDFAYLIDFGIARAASDTTMTSTGLMVGTLAYMAPERFGGTLDARSDVYALACVLHECLTGARPFPGDSLEQLVAGHLTAPPPRPSLSGPGIRAAFDDVIARGMAKDPDARYQTAPELAQAARAALTGPGPTLATTQPRKAPTPKPRSPRARPPQPKTVSASNAKRREEAKRKLQQEQESRAELARQRRNRLVFGFSIGGIAAIVVIAAVVIFMVANTGEHQETSATPSSSPTTSLPAGPGGLPPFTPSANLGANCQYPPSPDKAAKPAKPPRTGKVPTEPNQGKIGLMLANNESPCTVNSFVSLGQQGWFKDTKCHRLTTSEFLGVLQCGDPKGDGTGGPGYQFNNEYPTDQFPPDSPELQQPVIYPRGTLAMANAGPNTNGSQFFMVYRDSQLPPEYTVFGTIQADGLETLDKIAKAGLAPGSKQGDGAPVGDVIIQSVLLD